MEEKEERASKQSQHDSPNLLACVFFRLVCLRDNGIGELVRYSHPGSPRAEYNNAHVVDADVADLNCS